MLFTPNPTTPMPTPVALLGAMLCYIPLHTLKPILLGKKDSTQSIANTSKRINITIYQLKNVHTAT